MRTLLEKIRADAEDFRILYIRQTSSKSLEVKESNKKMERRLNT